MISRHIGLIAILCIFFSSFADCLNFTQSVAELIIRDLISEYDLSDYFDARVPKIQTQAAKSVHYQEQEYMVETEDGYQVTYYRITAEDFKKTPTKSNPILLHHGLLCSWNDWKMQGKEKSLAYRLADNGYDVWLGNSRGNTHGMKHNSINPQNPQFWNFTFHEMGTEDISAGIDFILQKTGAKQIIYIGHSQGTTILYTLLSTRPEYNEKIYFHIGVAPVAGIPHSTSIVAKYAPYAEKIAKIFGPSFLKHNKVTEFIMRRFCKGLLTSKIFKKIVFGIFGSSEEQFDKNLWCKEILKYVPAGTSTKNMVHMAQLISPGKFTHFDGDTPYNIGQITAPAMLYYGHNDILANERDVLNFYQKLPNPLGCEAVAHQQWNHADFLYGIDANILFNDKVITFVNQATSRQGFVQEEVQKSLQKRKENTTVVDDAVKKEVSQTLDDKYQYLYLRELGKSIVDIEAIVNRSITCIKGIIEKNSEHANEVVEKSFHLINTTTHPEQTSAEFLKEIEDFYHIINNEQPNLNNGKKSVC